MADVAAELDDVVLDDVHAAVVGYHGDAGQRSALVRELILDRLPLLADDRIDQLVRVVLDRIEGLGPLEPLINDPAVTDVLVNGPGSVWVERNGSLTCTDVVLDTEAIFHLIQRVVGPQGRRADRSQPTVDARLPNGGRMHAILPPVAVEGPYVSIRRPAVDAIGLGAFASEAVVDLLDELVLARRVNLLVCGATGAGKTTLVDALASRVDPSERLVVLEESSELRLLGRHVVRLATRRAGADGVEATDLGSLVTESLRMRPDRLILGEVRGSEAFALVQALSTGHSGGLATIHASDPVDALRRLEALALSAGVGLPHESLRHSVGAAIDAVVHVGRVDGRRQITAIGEVHPSGDPDRVRPLLGSRAGPPRRSRR